MRLRGGALDASVPPARPARRQQIPRISQQPSGEELSVTVLGTPAGPPRRRHRGGALNALVPPAGPARRQQISRISQQPSGEELSLTVPGTPAGPPRRGHLSRVSQQLLGNELSPNTSPGTSAERSRLPREDDSGQSLMFFRTPLAFDAKPEAGESVRPVRRKNLDDVIPVKRRKTAPAACGPPQALLDRLGPAGGGDQRKRVGTGTLGDGPLKSKVPQGRSPVLSGSTNHGASSPSASVSMNPFLAKKKLQSQHRMPTTAVAPGIPLASSPRWSTPLSTASPNCGSALPGTFAAAANKPSSKAEPTKQNLWSKSEAPQPRSMTAAKPGGNLRATSSRSGFDLKVWATKAKE